MRLVVLLFTVAGCGAARFEVRGAPSEPFEVAIVPGCPSEADGALSMCQKARALWAAHLWERGWVRRFVVSGAAVHSPYVEADALAAALSALGVPDDRIWIEPNALHTDENLYYSMQIVRELGLSRVAVASDAATMDCRMLVAWGQPCGAFTLDHDYARARDRERPGLLARVRSPSVSPWSTLADREREIARNTGRHRTPSWILYPSLGWMSAAGERWIPPGAPIAPPLVTWAARSSAGK